MIRDSHKALYAMRQHETLHTAQHAAAQRSEHISSQIVLSSQQMGGEVTSQRVFGGTQFQSSQCEEPVVGTDIKQTRATRDGAQE